MPRNATKPAAKGTAETTACPRCGKAVPLRGERGTCPSCGLAVRFVEAPERPCTQCGKPLALPPRQDAVRCGACGAWQAADPSRPLVGRAACPRCGRDVEVPLDKERAPCPRCGSMLDLGGPVRDTL